MKDIILTGDRPTGKLHLGHYVGSIKNRVKIQNEGNYDKMYVLIADAQALTDNYFRPEKVKENVIEVALDYLACGIDPKKTVIAIQSYISELTEFTYYYLNLVTVARLYRNPTVKSEIKEKKMEESLPAGFFVYPVSQAADITAFNATIIPVGEDQMPMIEQSNEIVRKFNSIYGDTLVECKAMLPEKEVCLRLPGLDGVNKMSKSLNNCIYLADSEEQIKKKVMSMYTDPNHIQVCDPGNVECNTVFTYLDALCTDDCFKKHLPEYNNLEELKNHYRKGGLGDVVIKKFLFNVINDEFKPIRERRIELSKDLNAVYKILEEGSKQAKKDAAHNLEKIKKAMKIDYFTE